jgi:hypothetical protein
MGPSETILESIEYRIAFVSADSVKVLVLENSSGYEMPRVSIPRWTRPARELRKAIHACFGIHALILDLSLAGGLWGPFAVAEVLSCDFGSSLVPVDISSIPASTLSEEERRRIEEITQGSVESPFARIGWIRDAIAWLESATGQSLSSRGRFEQYSAGRGSSLVRFQMDDGSAYWLKAAGGPNRHEFAVTSVLSHLCGVYVPWVVDSRTSWNAWLAAEEATSLEALPRQPKELLRYLRKAVDALAAIQIRTAGRTDALLAAGAFDQRPAVLSSRSAAFFSYLEEAMAQENPADTPGIERKRLEELHHIFEDSCERLEALEMPPTVVHGDMNLGNILFGSSHCQFIDWAEAYVGSPLTTFQHLLLLNPIQEGRIRNSLNECLERQYRTRLLAICEADRLDEAFLFMPLVAAFSALHVRGDWLSTPLRYDSRRQRSARTFARHIDKAGREPQLLAALRRRRLSCSSPSGASALAQRP